MYKSRLGTVIIDCQTDNLGREGEFWSKALGGTVSRQDPEGRYIDLCTDAAEPQVILQNVEHPSRIHIDIDIEIDDIEAEVKRPQAGDDVRWSLLLVFVAAAVHFDFVVNTFLL